jgi:hypothetical protein
LIELMSLRPAWTTEEEHISGKEEKVGKKKKKGRKELRRAEEKRREGKVRDRWRRKVSQGCLRPCESCYSDFIG